MPDSLLLSCRRDLINPDLQHLCPPPGGGFRIKKIVRLSDFVAVLDGIGGLNNINTLLVCLFRIRLRPRPSIDK